MLIGESLDSAAFTIEHCVVVRDLSLEYKASRILDVMDYLSVQGKLIVGGI